MTDPLLPRVLAAQSGADVRLLPLTVVRAGPDAVRDHLRQLGTAARGPQIVLCDALDEDDLDTIADATRFMRLIAGGAGLGRAVAHTVATRPSANEVPADVIAAGRGPTAVLSGSCSAATLAQVDAMAARYPAFRFGAEELADSPGLVERALAWASQQLTDSPVLITASQSPDQVARAQRRLGAAYAAELVETALSTIAVGLRTLGVSKLIVAGGETSGAVVSRLGVRQVRIGRALAPGVPWIYTTVGPPLLLALKSGNFGGPTFFLDAVTADLT